MDEINTSNNLTNPQSKTKIFQNKRSKQVGISLILSVIILTAVTSYFLGFKVGSNSTNINYPSITPTQVKQLTSPIPTKLTEQDSILIHKSEGWGPCPTFAEPCSRETILYNSGKLTISGKTGTEKKLSQEEINSVKAEIKKQDIINKTCDPGDIVVDSFIFYTINFEGKEKKLHLLGCEEEITKIESIYSSYLE